ncbi:MAG: STAS domain-containing protein [Bacteroidales bacterium]
MITTEKRGSIEIITFTDSKLNALVAEEIREQICHFFSEPYAQVVISLKGIEYIDSTGFGSLLAILRSAKNNYGTLKICSVEPHVHNIFQTLHLNTAFDIYDNMDECINSFI